MTLNAKEKNPIYRHCLRFCDVRPGVKFVSLHADAELKYPRRKGTFISKPYSLKLLYSEYCCADAIVNGQVKTVYLADMGVVRDPFWNPVWFTIFDNPKSRTKYWRWLNKNGRSILARAAGEWLESQSNFCEEEEFEEY